MRAPTDKQLAILRYLTEYLAKNWFQPSTEEMAAHFGYKSQNSINEHLMWLERKGLVIRSGQKSRAIIITAAGRAL